MGKDTTKKGAEKAPTTEKEIERIGEIVKNARGTWFVLLGSLVFAAITLASVKDASFFITSEQTKLPLLGISVPITSFFWAGALLVTAFYSYLHLYLEQLWDALGEADARIGDKPLADVIHPWLVSDAALRVRDMRRADVRNQPANRKLKNRLRRQRGRRPPFIKRFLRDLRKSRYETMPRSARQRGMTLLSNLVSIALVWGFGLIIIGWFWWRSMPAHSFVSNDWPFLGLTGWLGLLLVWSLLVFWRSGSYAMARLGSRGTRFPAPVLFIACVGIIASLSFFRAHHDIWEGYPRINRSELARDCTDHQEKVQKRKICGYVLNFAQEFIRPARAEMKEVVFTQKPGDWKGFDLAKQEFRLRWCKQLKKEGCAINPLDETARFDEKEEEKFETAWKRQQKATLATFNKPDLRGKRLEGADLRFAELEGVRLEKARLQGADLSHAEMQGADLTEARMQGSDLTFAQMQGAVLIAAKMQGADLGCYGFEESFCAMLQGADLTEAEMQGADLRFAQMQVADLTGAEMQGAVLSLVQMQGANLSGARMHGTMGKVMELQSTNLSEGNFTGVSLRFVDFTEADVTKLRNFEKSFGDGSVDLAGLLVTPDGWCETVLSDAQYWGRYQGWLKEYKLDETYDSDITKHPLIPFSEPCPK